MKRIVVLALVACGCQSYAHRSRHNAPGIVDLDTPPPREVGSATAFVPPAQPGSETIVVFVMPNFVIGNGRRNLSSQAAYELGVSFRVERTVDDGAALLHKSAFAITAGVGLAQFYETRPTLFGATFVELNYRNLIKVIPFDVGVGAAIYPGADVGAQLSVRFPGLLVRGRYFAEGGFELMAGYEIPIPFFFGRSR